MVRKFTILFFIKIIMYYVNNVNKKEFMSKKETYDKIIEKLENIRINLDELIKDDTKAKEVDSKFFELMSVLDETEGKAIIWAKYKSNNLRRVFTRFFFYFF